MKRSAVDLPRREFRLATVRATGQRYAVVRIDFGTNRVYCLGEVVRYRGTQTTHAALEKRFELAAVGIEVVAKTEALVLELFAQGVRAVENKELPGYLTPEESSDQDRRRRALKQVADRAVRAAVRGDLEPMRQLLGRVSVRERE